MQNICLFCKNVHYGSIAIVSSTGETIAYTGDIERQTYMRSASKPIHNVHFQQHRHGILLLKFQP